MKTLLTTLLISSLLSFAKAEESQLMLEFKLVNVPEDVELPRPLKRLDTLSLPEHSQFLRASGIDVMSAPKLVTLPGQDAEIYIGQEAMQYMEKKGDHYTLKSLKKDVGIRIKVNGEISKQTNEVTLDCRVSVSLLEGRESLPGVHLEIGKPIINDHSLQQKATLKDSTWYVLDILSIQPATQQQTDALYILCKATRVNPQGEPETLPVEIEADSVKVNADGSSTYSGHVRIQHEDSIFLADRITLRKQPLWSDNKIQITSQSMSVDPETGHATFIDATLLMNRVKIESDRLTAQSKQPVKATSNLEKKLKLIVPTMQFQDVSLTDALAFLTLQSRQLDPEKEGINILLKADAKKDVTLTLSLKQVPMKDALRYVSEIAGLKMIVEETAVVITDR